MSLIQVSLLRHKRAGETGEELHYALAATINGIAAIPARGARSPPRDSVSASA